jgi:hypothetical protein
MCPYRTFTRSWSQKQEAPGGLLENPMARLLRLHPKKPKPPFWIFTFCDVCFWQPARNSLRRFADWLDEGDEIAQRWIVAAAILLILLGFLWFYGIGVRSLHEGKAWTTLLPTQNRDGTPGPPYTVGSFIWAGIGVMIPGVLLLLLFLAYRCGWLKRFQDENLST